MADLTKKAYRNLVMELAEEATDFGMDYKHDGDGYEWAREKVAELARKEQDYGGVLSTYDKQLQVLRLTQNQNSFQVVEGSAPMTSIISELASGALYEDVRDWLPPEEDFSEEDEDY